MKVLVSVRPYWGHLQPVLPLLEALDRHGHRIVVATADELAVEIEQLGYGWLGAGVHPGHWASGGDPSYGPDPIRAKANDLLAAADDIAPNLVLRDATDLAGSLAAEMLGVPAVTYSVSHYLPARVWRRLAGPGIAAVRAEFGLVPDPGLRRLAGAGYLDVLPPFMQGVEIGELPGHLVVRYEPRDVAFGSSSPVPTSVGKPAVLVTLGTVFNDRSALWRTMLRALSALDVMVVATGLPTDLAGLEGGLSANVRPTGYVPHSTLLPDCAAIVCHGGFNTVLGAVCAGVPLVCIPIAGDQHYNAAMVDQLGLGIRLHRSRLTVRALREAVVTVLGDPSYRARVQVARAMVAELPPAESAVATLERLVKA